MMPTRMGMAWTEAEDERVLEMRAGGASFREIGDALGRGKEATRKRYYEHLWQRNGQVILTNPNEPEPGPAPLAFDLDQLLLTCDVLTKQLDALPTALQPMVLDWLNKQYR